MNQQGLSFFVCYPTNEVFAYRNSGDDLHYSPDGYNFFELKNRGFGGSYDEHTISFEDPHHDRKGRFARKGDELRWDNKLFRKVEGWIVMSSITPLPIVRDPEYFLKMADGTYIYVSGDRYHYSNKTVKMFVGQAPYLNQLHILEIERIRDGGTVMITTTEGTLYWPTPARKNAVATWNDIPLEILDVQDYVITEYEGAVTFAKK